MMNENEFCNPDQNIFINEKECHLMGLNFLWTVGFQIMKVWP